MALTLLHNFEYIRRLYYVQMNYYHTQLIKNNARLVSN